MPFVTGSYFPRGSHGDPRVGGWGGGGVPVPRPSDGLSRPSFRASKKKEWEFVEEGRRSDGAAIQPRKNERNG